MDLLRFSTAGSVDDGKSTLIGRLLYDTKTIFEDQLAHVEETSRRRGDERTNLALLTDGLRAEREQGITIDVAYRYFATPRRKFIIADTPGHIQYTRNMVTGASTANLAIVLVDARKGLLEQSRRHSFIASLLRIPHLVVCINKMDLVDFSEERFDELRAEFSAFAMKLEIPDITFIPVSALLGDNVVAALRGEPTRPYAHKYAGSVASLGLHKGVAQVYGVKLRGWPAWFMHRTYHMSRVPTINRKVRVVADWSLGLFFRREIVNLGSLAQPREQFARVAAGPREPR